MKPKREVPIMDELAPMVLTRQNGPFGHTIKAKQGSTLRFWVLDDCFAMERIATWAKSLGLDHAGFNRGEWK